MEERATGLILRQRPFSETSLIIQWLTPGAGRISTMAKGARRPKSPLRGKLDLFYLADFSFSRSRSSDLHNLREVEVRDTRAALRRDIGWLQQASYATHLIEIATEAETPIPEMFDLLNEWFNYLPHQPPAPHAVVAFELKLLELAGLRPDPDELRLTTAGKEAMNALAESPWNEMAALNFPEPILRQVETFLHGFLIYHLGRIPKDRHGAVYASF